MLGTVRGDLGGDGGHHVALRAARRHLVARRHRRRARVRRRRQRPVPRVRPRDRRGAVADQPLLAGPPATPSASPPPAGSTWRSAPAAPPSRRPQLPHHPGAAAEPPATTCSCSPCRHRRAVAPCWLAMCITRTESARRCRHSVQAQSRAMGRNVAQETTVNARSTSRLVRGGDFAAEVNVELLEADGGWAPYLRLEDAYKLDRCPRRALRRRHCPCIQDRGPCVPVDPSRRLPRSRQAEWGHRP